MDEQDRIELVKNFYEAFAKADKAFIENHMADGFSFSAPPDPFLDRKGYFERCWLGAGNNRTFDIRRMIVNGNEVVVTYEMSHHDGSKGRNTEIFTIAEDKVKRVEVYFGWNVK